MKPVMRSVHWKLGEGSTYSRNTECNGTYLWVSIRFLSMIGKIVPPILEPLAMQANASPRFFLNQCATTPAAALKTTPLASYGEDIRMVE